MRVVAQWIADNNVIQNAYKVARAKYDYPASFRIAASPCNTINAYYVAERDTVYVCYELIQNLYDRAIATRAVDGLSETERTDRFVTAFNFVVLHELGHAALHNRNAKATFRDKEAEADNFSYVLLIEAARTEDNITTQLFAVQMALNAFENHYPTLTMLADEHALPLQRFLKYMCLATARSPRTTDLAIKKFGFTADRIAKCRADWHVMAAAAASLTKR